LLLGPGDDRAMFEELAATLDSGPRAPFHRSDIARQIRRIGTDADALLFFRAPGDSDDWVAMTATRSERSLDFGFLVGMQSLAERANKVRPWSMATFDDLAKDAFAVVLDINDPAQWDEVDRGQGALRLPLPPRFKALMSDRLALVVRPGKSGPVEFAVAFETIDTEGIAEAGDQMLARVVQRVIGDKQLTQRVSDFDVMPATAIRSVDVSQSIGSMESFGWKAGPHVSWQTRRGEMCNPGQNAGWWTVGVGPDTVELLGKRLAADDRSDRRPSMPWISLGVIRPAAALEALEQSGIPVDPIFDPLRGIDELSWRAVEISSGTILGSGRFELAEPASEEQAD
ncbi:MAG: hypothetical protein AAFX05_09665, partial [Planctomycetota bacterium]